MKKFVYVTTIRILEAGSFDSKIEDAVVDALNWLTDDKYTLKTPIKSLIPKVDGVATLINRIRKILFDKHMWQLDLKLLDVNRIHAGTVTRLILDVKAAVKAPRS